MSAYLFFFSQCLMTGFKFFKCSTLQKARILFKCNLFFEAGIHFMRCNQYEQALQCFSRCQAYRHMFTCYKKLGQVSCALELAEKHRLYKEGALLCMRTHNTYKAAYFYSFFDTPKAVKLYKRIGASYPLAHLYLKNGRYQVALQTFLKCEQPLQRLEGIALLEEVAIVLYRTKQFATAYKLFVQLNDPFSALECAKALKDKHAMEKMAYLLADNALQEGLTLEAAYHIAPYNQHLARLYYYLHKINKPSLTFAIYNKQYMEVLTYCFNHHYFELAQELTRHWIKEDTPYDTPLSA